MGKDQRPDPPGLEIGNQDIWLAMKEIPGYLDITPEDFKAIYLKAYAHALERLRRVVPASRIMTREVSAVQANDSLEKVASVMAQRRVSGVPVLDGEQVVGVISEKDFWDAMGAQKGRHFMEVVAHCLDEGPCLANPLRVQNAGQLMQAPAVTVGPDTPTTEIAELLRQKKINRAPVVDGRGRLLGIVSRADLLAAGYPAVIP